MSTTVFSKDDESLSKPTPTSENNTMMVTNKNGDHMMEDDNEEGEFIDPNEQFYYYSSTEDRDDENEKEQVTTSEQQQDDGSEQPYQLIKGTLAQNLMEKIVRNKIIACTYYKLHCFGLTAETMIDRAMELESVGGTFGGNRKPTAFLCLLFKLLQIQPEREIILAYITNRNHKYVTVLGAVYLRLTGKPVDVYTYLELLYSDYRKIVKQRVNGKYELVHMDEIADELLTSNYMFDMNLPYLPKRKLLEDAGQLDRRVSVLSEQQLEQMALEEETKEAKQRDEQSRNRGDERSNIRTDKSLRNTEYDKRENRDYRRSDRYGEERRSERRYEDNKYYDRRDDRRRDSRDVGYDNRDRRGRDEYDRSHHRREERHETDRYHRSYERADEYDRYERSDQRRDYRRDTNDGSMTHPGRRDHPHDDKSNPRDARGRTDDVVPYSKYSQTHKKHSNELSMSVEDTNKLRAKLGLRPLRL